MASKKENIIKPETVIGSSQLPIYVLSTITSSDYNRFWTKVDLRADESICWNWKGCGRPKGYGIFVKNSIHFTAHRVAYYLFHKKDPKELHVLHTCDNPKCVNPNHLFLGTNNDNVQDKVKKGRQARNVDPWNKGKGNGLALWDSPNCPLSKKDFIKAKKEYETKKMSIDDLAKKYKSSHNTMSLGLRKLGTFVPKVHTVLDKETVSKIRNEYSPEKRNSTKLAKKYNIGNKTIMDIVKRITWRHL